MMVIKLVSERQHAMQNIRTGREQHDPTRTAARSRYW